MREVGIKYPHALFKDLMLMKLRSANPHVRLVILLRDPIDWLESTYRWYSVLGVDPPPFSQHALGVNEGETGLRMHAHEAHFVHWISRLWSFGFNRSEVYLTHIEAFDRDAAGRLCSFLGVRGPPPGSVPRSNLNRVSSFDLCHAIQSDTDTRAAAHELKITLMPQYTALTRLLQENGESAPPYFSNRRTRCERLWWG